MPVNAFFFEDEDKSKFLLLMQEGVERFGDRVHAFCLMDNHVHLLLQAGEDPLGKAMQNITFRYARYLNKKQAKSGHQFQGRYYGGIIEKEKYLLEVLKYIHLNPVKAKMVNHPDEFAWSSHHLYVGQDDIPWVEKNFCMSLMGSSSNEARSNYCHFLDQEQPENIIEKITGQCSAYFIGEDNFMEKVQNAAHEKIIVKCSCIEAVVGSVCDHFKVSPKIVQSEHRSNQASHLRGVIGYIILNFTDQSLSAFARYTGKSLSAISRSTRNSSDQMTEKGGSELNLHIKAITNHIQKK